MFYKSIRLTRTYIPILLLTVCVLPVSCNIYPELVEKGVKSSKSERCGDCHRDIYYEWKNSPHAQSFKNTAFKEETNNYQFTFCLGCHVPETIFVDARIEPRMVNMEEGVNCISCHLNDCKLSGPTPARGPHPVSENNPFYRTSELCGKCHVDTFRVWQESDTSEERKTCQDCHMPAIQRKLIQDDPWQKIYPKREGKQHLFSYHNLLKENDRLLIMSFTKVIGSEGRIEGILEIENTSIPHSVPTGDYGYREVVVTIELLDMSDQVIGHQKESLFVELKTALKYKEKRIIPFCFQYEEGSWLLRANMARTSFDKDTVITLAEVTYRQ
ncbi:MAG: multiheme c-type cytochrome [Candidatus Loosdrechtia sp.]|uniref:multiheme c-type cytochrome n=1 Tax=Candidatus Loosdrechtia sp. TaxID=3101272 RepID=UPI003A6C96D9|nr:MAG: multiheme c-type cytochrome [Candidatus Jettenia sp. AMX2]